MRKGARVWLFGDDINTDLIIPGRYLENYDPAHLAAHAMEGANKEFASHVRPGDIVVAGRNFGCGSSREQAVVALKQAGVSAVVARSFARIFYRNAINLGFPVIVSAGADSVFKDGDSAVLDMSESSLKRIDGSESSPIEPIPEHLRMILDKGGLVPFIKAKLKSG